MGATHTALKSWVIAQLGTPRARTATPSLRLRPGVGAMASQPVYVLLSY